MPSLESLASGGYEPDNEIDFASDFDLWVEQVENLTKDMSDEELHRAALLARIDGDITMARQYEFAIDLRTPVINISGQPMLTNEPVEGWDDPDQEDRWDEYKENYMAEAEGYVEPDELPF